MKQNKHEKKTTKKKYVILGIAIFLVFIICTVSGYFIFQLSKMKTKSLSGDLGISDVTLKKIQDAGADGKVINIALFGVDRRNTGENGNSDSIMIASVDTVNKKVKISSIMRDSYVKIDGLGMAKINAAYQKGGAQLAVKTLNQNFNLDIKDYVTVDFFSLEKVIDALGGVQIDVKQAEIPFINNSVKETASIEKSKYTLVSHSGLQTLTGRQAVAYARIRYVGNNDFERTDRQRTVVNQLFDKIKEGGISKYPSIISTVLPETETSLSSTDLLSLGTKMLTSGTTSFEQTRFPADGSWTNANINGQAVLKIDLTKTADQLFDFIYKDVQPTASK